MENLQVPNLNELISVQFKALQDYLSFLTETDKKLNIDVSLINNETNNFKKLIKDVSSKTERLDTKLTNTENSLFSAQAKFADLENKITTSIKRSEDSSGIVLNKLNFYEDNLNKLNRLTEENIKNVTKVESTLDTFITETKEANKKSEDYESRLTTFERNIDVLTEKYDKLRLSFAEEISKMKSKVTESDVRLLKVSEAVTEIHTASPDVRVGGGSRRLSMVNTMGNSPAFQGFFADGIGPNGSNNLVLTELTKLNKEIDNIKKKNKENEEEIQSLNKINEELIEKVNKLKPGKETDDNHLTVPSTHHRSLIRNNSINNDNAIGETLLLQNKSLGENFARINDNVKSLSINIGLKANKDEFNNFTASVNSEFDKLNQLYTDSFKSIDLRIQNLITANKMLGGGNNRDGSNGVASYESSNFTLRPNENELEEVVAKISKNVINTEFNENRKFIESFLQTTTFQDIKNKLDNNKDEIDKLYESVVDIRKTYIDNKKEVAGESEPVDIIKPRLQNLETSMIRMRTQIEEISRNVDGEIGELIAKEHGGDTGNVRDYIKNISHNMKTLSDKIDTVVTKQTGLNTEIIMRVKKDLTMESGRILDEFRMDLKNSIGNIEDKLKEKVDRFGLDEFGKKIDNKFHTQINRKIDISDLRKNNNLIVKKIDTLENKISKTLVDTLIDLQMEEAPLLVKKSAAGDKCASCNQVLHNSHQVTYHSMYHSTEIPLTDKTLRPPLITPKNYDYLIIDDKPEKNAMRSSNGIHLPEVKQKKRGNILKTDEQTEKELNSLLDQELEKTVVKPESLVKNTNKLFNKFEKKKNK
jgi:DNA repair exonuclease SbcCD ATPase subunit